MGYLTLIKPLKHISLLGLGFLLVFCSCKKSNRAVSNAPVDVYVAGTIRPNGSLPIAAYWKNDSLVQLTNRTTSCWAYSIAVSGSDVYVAGTITTASGNYVAVYWKNGVMTMLTDSTTFSGANCITISGSDVYIGGFDPNGLAYWKNGNIVYLPATGSGQVSGIAVSGSDVYAAGQSSNSNSAVATYWKNGVRDTLTTGLEPSNATSIAVHGSDVYIAGGITGFLIDTAVYWKNGIQVDLTNSSLSGWAEGITLDANQNVYVAGQAEPLADLISPGAGQSMIYWKNGALADANWLAAGSSNLQITGIAVAGTDVYVAGSFGNFATYWKNDSAVQYTTYSGQLYGIALAPR